MIPNDISHEDGILSCYLQAKPDIQEEILGLVTDDHFHHESRKLVFRELVSLGKGAALGDLIASMKTKGTLERAGGIVGLTEMHDRAAGAGKWRWYYDKAEETRYRRAMYLYHQAGMAKAGDLDIPLEELRSEAETGILAISSIHDDDCTITSAQAVQMALDGMMARIEKKGSLGGHPTGSPKLDDLLDGLKGGTVITIAGRPGAGKSSYGMQVADCMASDHGLPGSIISLEMCVPDLKTRDLYARSGITLNDLKQGTLTEQQLMRLTKAADALSRAPLFYIDKPGATDAFIASTLRRHKKKYDIKFAVVDYIQLIQASSRRGRDNKVDEVTDASRMLKKASRELNIPIIVLAQISRSGVKGGKRPALEDLKNSGAIEEDSDIVILIHREWETREDGTEDYSEEAFLTVAKHRGGPTGCVKMRFHGPSTRFIEWDDNF